MDAGHYLELGRRYRFAASHRLYSPRLSEEENRRIYGKCANPAGHGHDYGLEITVTGEIDPSSGQIVARDRLDALVAERVPTAENIALAIERELAAAIAAERPGTHLLRVRLEETRKNSFETGEAR